MRNLGKDRGKLGLGALLAAALLLTGATPAALGEDADWFQAFEETEADRIAAAGDPQLAPDVEAESPKMIPWMGVEVAYTLVSDYMWRGLNFSEYSGEGREDPNHQLSVDVSVDLAELTNVPIGTIGANVWFEWYAGQERLTPWSDANLQEVDYTAYWTYTFDEIMLDVTVGWIAYHYPRLRDSGSPDPADEAYTQEVYATLEWDDALVFGQSILNPTMTYYLDVDDVQASFIMLGVSHEFALADYGCEEMVVLKDTTVTPSATLGIDHRYYDKYGTGGVGGTGTRLGYMEYGLDVTVDLSSALGIPSQFGTLSVGGFLNFIQSFHDVDATANDQLYGGMNLAWAW